MKINAAHFLSKSSFWIVNKHVAAHFKDPMVSVYLSFLVDCREYFSRGKGMIVRENKKEENVNWFYLKSNDVENHLYITYYYQNKYNKALQDQGFIETARFGVGGLTYYTIYDEKIALFFASCFQTISKPVFKPFENMFLNDFKTLYKQEQKQQEQKERKEPKGSKVLFPVENEDQPVPKKNQAKSKKSATFAKAKEQKAVEVLGYLSEVSGKRFESYRKGKPTQNVKDIITFLNKGFSVDDAKGVIDLKFIQWQNSKIIDNLKPITLFKRHGESYVEELNGIKNDPKKLERLQVQAKEKNNSSASDLLDGFYS